MNNQKKESENNFCFIKKKNQKMGGYPIAKTFKVNSIEIERINRLKEKTRHTQSALLDIALEILENKLDQGYSIENLLKKDQES